MKPRIYWTEYGWHVKTKGCVINLGSWKSAVRWALWYCDVSSGVI
jgi:hypothetical protein